MKRYINSFFALLVLLFGIFIWNIWAGSVDIKWGELVEILAGKSENHLAYQIVWGIRMPRVIAAIFLGGALAVAGYLLQKFFANPIAGPYVLGISSGAKLTVALTMIFLLGRGIKIGSAGMVAAAFVGSLLTMGIVLLLSLRVKRMSMLIVSGIMIGYICSAITDFCVTFANDSNIVNLHNWSQGSFSGMNWSQVFVLIPLVAVSVFMTILIAKPISAYELGEEYARNMGVNITVLRVSIILLSSLLAATVTAFAGPISFVGIAVPHLMKMLFQTTKPLVIIPACFLGGAVITTFCDGIARMLFAPTELSISSVTAVLLVPVVLAMMLKKTR